MFKLIEQSKFPMLFGGKAGQEARIVWHTTLALIAYSVSRVQFSAGKRACLLIVFVVEFFNAIISFIPFSIRAIQLLLVVDRTFR